MVKRSLRNNDKKHVEQAPIYKNATKTGLSPKTNKRVRKIIDELGEALDKVAKNTHLLSSKINKALNEVNESYKTISKLCTKNTTYVFISEDEKILTETRDIIVDLDNILEAKNALNNSLLKAKDAVEHLLIKRNFMFIIFFMISIVTTAAIAIMTSQPLLTIAAIILPILVVFCFIVNKMIVEGPSSKLESLLKENPLREIDNNITILVTFCFSVHKIVVEDPSSKLEPSSAIPEISNRREQIN